MSLSIYYETERDRDRKRGGEGKGREGTRGKRRNPAGTAKDKELHSLWEPRRGVQIRARAAGGPQESATT